MIQIDGSQGEGGGQIIRTALALSLITGKAFSVFKVRAGRQKPGLQNQHLACVQAAKEIGQARVDGARLQSTAFTFSPGFVEGGSFIFKIGTAGSALLVLQTVLAPLMVAKQSSSVTIEGGTHNPHAPPFDFIELTFLPLINRIGPKVKIHLERYGFYPPGGGRITATIEPSDQLTPISLDKRGPTQLEGRLIVVKLPRSVAQREEDFLLEHVPQLSKKDLCIEESDDAVSPGNIVVLQARSEQLTETITQIGERGLRAEVVAERAAQELNLYLAQDVPVGEHLADQLLLPLALAGGGSYLTGKPSLHTTTNIDVIKLFLPVEIDIEQTQDELFRISINS